ncbi:MAG: hypothetical protein N3H31_00070 [Candidatus Nezhaarchaeota archaeon]|nr:hypothetical protein [Candidatus Nezhaarchaeota archaeon]
MEGLGQKKMGALRRIFVEPIAFESLGVRGMCTYVETPDVKLLIDAGASLGLRFNLLPHPREYRALERAKRRMRQVAERCEVVTVSHYHYDHYTPAWREREWVLTWSCIEDAEAIYAGKVLLVKDARSRVNLSQRRRGWLFGKAVSPMADRLEVADGREFAFSSTKLRFSMPVPHGEEGSTLGYVLMLCVEYGDERLVHASDVQGPASESALGWILAQHPSMVIVGGPPVYLEEGKVSVEALSKGARGLARLIESVPMVVVDHHVVRALEWRSRLGEIYPPLRKQPFMSAAELAGLGEEGLEARRRLLYEEEPPSEGFLKWMRLRREDRRRTPPPLS